jgi:hypothetical protein
LRRAPPPIPIATIARAMRQGIAALRRDSRRYHHRASPTRTPMQSAKGCRPSWVAGRTVWNGGAGCAAGWGRPPGPRRQGVADLHKGTPCAVRLFAVQINT